MVTFPGEKNRTTTQTGWSEVCYDLNGKQWATENSNDNVFSTVSNSAQLAAMLLSSASERRSLNLNCA